MRFESYINDNSRDIEILIEMAMLIDDVSLNEAFDLGVLKSAGKGLLKAVGMGTHKSGDGLIQVALKSGKIMAEFVYHALRSATGNKESIQRVKEIANTEITKEQFLDFLLKLDMATLHLVSGPLHAIDAWTGWHVWAHIKSKAEIGLSKAKKAIQDLADASKDTSEEVKKKIKSLIHGIARLFGLDDMQTIIKAI